jgi:hypothetical protein
MLIMTGIILLILGGWLMARSPGDIGRHRA